MSARPSGFTRREYVLSATSSPNEAKLVKGAQVDLARGEMVEAEPTRLVEKRSSREMDSDDEREELWQESVRAYNARGSKQKRLAWCEYHQEQTERHRAVERHQEDRYYHEPRLRGG